MINFYCSDAAQSGLQRYYNVEYTTRQLAVDEERLQAQRVNVQYALQK